MSGPSRSKEGEKIEFESSEDVEIVPSFDRWV